MLELQHPHLKQQQLQNLPHLVKLSYLNDPQSVLCLNYEREITLHFSQNFYFPRYILGVESPLICDILNRADENGIMEVYPSMDRDIITDDETLDELVEKAGRSESSSNVKPSASFSPRYHSSSTQNPMY